MVGKMETETLMFSPCSGASCHRTLQGCTVALCMPVA